MCINVNWIEREAVVNSRRMRECIKLYGNKRIILRAIINEISLFFTANFVTESVGKHADVGQNFVHGAIGDCQQSYL